MARFDVAWMRQRLHTASRGRRSFGTAASPLGAGATNATLSASPETGPNFGHLLVLCRDPKIDGPFGAQSTPLPFFLEAERVETIATAIGQHFASPA